VLLDLQLREEEGYVQSRWNMVGELYGLPWKPKIDVNGRTKFWFRKGTDVCVDDTVKDDSDRCKSSLPSFVVYFYDEEWEMLAGKVLLQLITPAGTIRNSSLKTDVRQG